MDTQVQGGTHCVRGLLLLASVLAFFAAAADAAQTSSATNKKHHAGHASHPVSGAMPAGARNFYASYYGVDQLSAQLAESGQLVRFSYRIVDAQLAKPFLDKISNPQMLDEKARAVLSVPSMEKVGPLRQSGSVDVGKVYWVLFSNRGGVVKHGDRVSVVIGSRRIDGLIVAS
jgi:hypothetical protein